MKLQIFESKDQAIDTLFNIYKEAHQEGVRVYGLATGSTPEGLYKRLVESDIDFNDSVSINLDEYYGLGKDHPQSYAYFMNKHLFSHKPFKVNYLPNGLNENEEEEANRYEKIIAENPIELQLLGVGENGHIAFNEPGTPFDSKTHLVDLTEDTVKVNSRFFEEGEIVPNQAYTMGLASIMSSKKVVLVAFGERKAEAIKAMVEGEVTPDLPASILQNHPDALIILDKEAASLLSK